MKRRENNHGTLVKKPNGLYLAKWMYHGQTFTKSTGTKRESEARKMLEKFVKPFIEDTEIEVLSNVEAKLKAKRQLVEEERKPSDIPVDEIVVNLLSKLETQDWDERTKILATRIVEKAIKWFVEKYKVKTMRQISKLMVEQYLLWAVNHYAVSTYNTTCFKLKQVWNILSERGRYFENPFNIFKKRCISQMSHRRELTTEQIAKLIESCRDDEERLFIVVGIYTGLRCGDAARLRYSHIDFARNLISIIPNKTRKHMTIPIPIPIHKVLLKGLIEAKKWKIEGNDYVMPNVAASYNKDQIRHITGRIWNKAGIPIIEHDEKGKRIIVSGYHALRRTFVSLNIDAGMNPFLIQRLVGHSGIEMTAYYYNANREAMQKGINRMPEIGYSNVIDVQPIDYLDKSKEDKELQDMIDAMFDENGKPLPLDDKGNPIRDK